MCACLLPAGANEPEPRIVYFIYSLFMGLAALLLTPYWLVRGLRHGKYFFNLRERLGLSYPALATLPVGRAGAIWIHAVSVGEVLSGIPLARRLKAAYPDRPLIVSTATITGQALARERLSFADAVIYFPLDWSFCVRRAFAAVRPARPGNRNLAKFSAAGRSAQNPCSFCQRAHLGPFLCAISEVV